MRELLLIGIGAGDPDWITLQAVGAIQRLDVLFVVVKSDELDDLVQARRAVIARHRSEPLRIVELADPPRPWHSAPDYDQAVAHWRAERLAQWSDAVGTAIGEGEVGGFLVWGDPGLYESTLAICTELVAAAPNPITLDVIPGISSAFALAARHRIPLNRQGRAVQLSPARLLRSGMPDGIDDVVVMLDQHQVFASIDPTGLELYWGAYLGTPDELLIAGPLAEVRDEVLQVRTEAIARKGWMFDTYLLRRV